MTTTENKEPSQQMRELFNLIVNKKDSEKTKKITREALVNAGNELFNKIQRLELYLLKAKEIVKNPETELEKQEFTEESVKDLEQLFDYMKTIFNSFKMVFDFVYDIENDESNSFMDTYKNI